MKKPSLAAALASYAAIAILVGVTLNGPSYPEKLMRTIVWLMLAAFAIMTWTHKLRREREEREEREKSQERE